jgi:phenylpropionate dioxygenase-like ring-hydroxylating dioxygenase large terminal subunit
LRRRHRSAAVRGLIVTILYGDHLATALPKNRLIRHIAEQPRDEWQILEHLAMPFVLMPGTVVQWQAGHVELFSFRPHPTDPTRTLCRLSLLVPPHQPSDTALCDRNWERVCDTIPGEDFAVAEQVQANIDAGAVTELQIGHSERFLLEHLAAVDRLIAATTPGASCDDAVVEPPAMPAAAEI